MVTPTGRPGPPWVKGHLRHGRLGMRSLPYLGLGGAQTALCNRGRCGAEGQTHRSRFVGLIPEPHSCPSSSLVITATDAPPAPTVSDGFGCCLLGRCLLITPVCTQNCTG